MADSWDVASALIQRYESGGRNIKNPTSSAFGPWQVLDKTWTGDAPRAGVDLTQYPTAQSAPTGVQEQVAKHLYETRGYAPWAPYNPKLASAIGWTGGGKPEGYYQGEGEPGPALHLTLHPPEQPFPVAAFLDSLLGGKPFDTGGGAYTEEPDPLVMLDSLLGGSTGATAPQAPHGGDGTIKALQALPGPPPAAADVLSATPPLDAGAIKPIADPAAGLRPPAPGSTPPGRTPPETFLDSLLDQFRQATVEPMAREIPKAAGDVLNTLLGIGERTELAVESAAGAPARQPQIPVQPGLEALGGLADFATGGLLSPLSVPREAAAAAAPLARETAAAVPRMLADETGAMPLGRGPGFMPATPPTSTSGKAVAQVREAVNAFFSPTTVDPFSQEAEALIRQSTGRARRETEAANAALEPFRPLANRHVPEFDQWLTANKAGTLPPGAPSPKLLGFYDFVETRSGGTAYAGPPELRPLADELRRVYQERRAAIAAEPTTAGTGSIDDYMSHVWKEKSRARSLLSGVPPRTGSVASLKRRSIPTISDGIRRGLTPATSDPIETTMRYIANMDRFLAHNRVFRIGRSSGAIQFHVPGNEPDGWAALVGRLSDSGHGQKAYAPAAFARVYNNAISSGVYADQLGGSLYNAVLKTKNTLNSFVLGLSGYHAAAMAQEASASALARALGHVTEGDMQGALKQLGLGGMPVAKAVDDVLRTGRKLQRQYMRVDDYGTDYEKVAKLLAEGGGRILGRGQEWRGTAADNFFKSWKRGALKIEALAAGREIAGNPLRLPMVAARELARINDTVMAPIFDGMIPRLKSAAFFDEMKGWLDANPTAGRAEQMAKSRQLVDVIDDRFGELILDNIFWGKRTKQFLQLATTSLGWELGTVRSALGATADLARGQWTPRMRYLIGLAGAISLYNASYQYLKTGKAPEGAADLVAPQTGGKTPEGAPERALLPGYEKDALGWWHDPATEFTGKLSPLGRLGGELVTGRDYFGHEIAPFARFTPDWFKAYAKHIEQAATPIPLRSEILRGSNIGKGERFMGNRPAPEYVQNPQRAAAMETSRRLRDLQSKLRGLYAHGARTTEDRGEIERQANEIRRQIRQTQEDAAKRRDRGPYGGEVKNRMSIAPQ